LIEQANDPSTFPDAATEYQNLQANTADLHAGKSNFIVLTSDADDVTKKYLNSIDVSSSLYTPIFPDNDATYIRELDYDMSSIAPVVACPHTVDNVKPVSELKDLVINQCLIGTCTNGRLSDLKIAADILRGKKINPDVRLLVLPASKKVYEGALKTGIIETLVDSGGVLIEFFCTIFYNCFFNLFYLELI